MKKSSLIKIPEWLNNDNFLQVHDSFIINKVFVTFISPHFEIYLSDIVVSIGRAYFDNVDIAFHSAIVFPPKKSHHKKGLI